MIYACNIHFILTSFRLKWQPLGQPRTPLKIPAIPHLVTVTFWQQTPQKLLKSQQSPGPWMLTIGPAQKWKIKMFGARPTVWNIQCTLEISTQAPATRLRLVGVCMAQSGLLEPNSTSSPVHHLPSADRNNFPLVLHFLFQDTVCIYCLYPFSAVFPKAFTFWFYGYLSCEVFQINKTSRRNSEIFFCVSVYVCIFYLSLFVVKAPLCN